MPRFTWHRTAAESRLVRSLGYIGLGSLGGLAVASALARVPALSVDRFAAIPVGILLVVLVPCTLLVARFLDRNGGDGGVGFGGVAVASLAFGAGLLALVRSGVPASIAVAASFGLGLVGLGLGALLTTEGELDAERRTLRTDRSVRRLDLDAVREKRAAPLGPVTVVQFAPRDVRSGDGAAGEGGADAADAADAADGGRDARSALVVLPSEVAGRVRRSVGAESTGAGDGRSVDAADRTTADRTTAAERSGHAGDGRSEGAGGER